ncbi:hypothetical protein ACFE04_027898 [Oxalis oulophora]
MTSGGGRLFSVRDGEYQVHEKIEDEVIVNNITTHNMSLQVSNSNLVSNISTTSNTTSNSNGSSSSQPLPPPKKKRNLPGNPDPSSEVIALSPTTLMATNRFVCEICNKGFQRDQNLQLHRRGHNLPWKLKQRTISKELIRKKVYVCPEPSCVHHNPARALGDLTGIKKHFCRKHGEKKWKCDKCSKKYAVQSDWKAHFKTCGTKEYTCDCGTIFSRRDSFITHRAFCDVLAEENNKTNLIIQQPPDQIIPHSPILLTSDHSKNPSSTLPLNMVSPLMTSSFEGSSTPSLSATELLLKAAQMGSTTANHGNITTMAPPSFGPMYMQNDQIRHLFNGTHHDLPIFPSPPLMEIGGYDQNMENNNNSNKSMQSTSTNSNSTNIPNNIIIPRGENQSRSLGSSRGDDDDTTRMVDFLGVNNNGDRNLHEHEEMEFGAAGFGDHQPRIMQGLNHFHEALGNICGNRFN